MTETGRLERILRGLQLIKTEGDYEFFLELRANTKSKIQELFDEDEFFGYFNRIHKLENKSLSSIQELLDEIYDNRLKISLMTFINDFLKGYEIMKDRGFF